MQNVQIFNELLMDFLTNLSKTYSHESAIATAPAKLQMLIETNSKKPHEEFMAAVAPYVSDITERNDSFFTEKYKNIPGLNAINFAQNWQKSPQETKDAIWEYMYNLLLLGGSLQNIPEDLMSDISTFVSGYEQATAGQDLNMEHLIGSLRNDSNLSHLFSS